VLLIVNKVENNARVPAIHRIFDRQLMIGDRFDHGSGERAAFS
jgi:hypothetical protein